MAGHCMPLRGDTAVTELRDAEIRAVLGYGFSSPALSHGRMTLTGNPGDN